MTNRIFEKSFPYFLHLKKSFKFIILFYIYVYICNEKNSRYWLLFSANGSIHVWVIHVFVSLPANMSFWHEFNGLKFQWRKNRNKKRIILLKTRVKNIEQLITELERSGARSIYDAVKSCTLFRTRFNTRNILSNPHQYIYILQ